MVFACEKFRPYILGSYVIIHTDHVFDGKEKCQTKTGQMGIITARV